MKYLALSPPAEDILATSALGDIWKSGGSVAESIPQGETGGLSRGSFVEPLLSETRTSTIPSSHATGRDPLRHTFDPLIEGSSWSKRLSLRGKLGAS